MKKRIVTILLILFCGIPFVWLVPLIRCEVLTTLNGDEFREGYQATNMLDRVDYFKILNYSSSRARIYYVTKGESYEDNCINIIRFVKK